MEDVFYVPRLKCNLLSVGQLEDKNYGVKFKNKVWTIYDNLPHRQLIGKVERKKDITYQLRLRYNLSKSTDAYETNSQYQYFYGISSMVTCVLVDGIFSRRSD